jgi:hypothetical protein
LPSAVAVPETSIAASARVRVSLTAFDSRFTQTWRSMSRSPCAGGRSPMSNRTLLPSAPAWGSAVTSRASSLMSTGFATMSRRDMREKLSMSSISCPIRTVAARKSCETE